MLLSHFKALAWMYHMSHKYYMIKYNINVISVYILLVGYPVTYLAIDMDTYSTYRNEEVYFSR